MSIEHLITLLPCHSLDDFPIYAIGDEANGLLTAWTTPWHPALIAEVEHMPRWCRLDDLPDDTRRAILFLPGGKAYDCGMPEVVTRVVDDSDCTLITDRVDRPECLRAAFTAAGIDGSEFADREPLAQDFLALGYWYLQVQMLTRHMRYTTNLDEDRFADALISAAKFWQAGNQENAREQLSVCFSTLAQERDHYYPVEAYLIDLTLVADTTTPSQLMNEFKHENPVNVWLTTATLDRLADESPETIQTLQTAIGNEQASIYGGESDESPLSFLSIEDILDRLRSASAKFDKELGSRPQHFGRRRFGMTPRLPQLLDQLGYFGVVHATLDDGRFPEGDQTRTRWAGLDGTTIETIAGVPCDASLPETFLRLAMRMGESMESDFVAAVCLAHWAGRASPWYDDLRCGTRYGLALGRFATLQQFFADTGYTGQLDQFSPDQYRSPYLKQTVATGEADPISRWSNYWRYQAAVEALHTLQSWTAMLDPSQDSSGQRDLNALRPKDHVEEDQVVGIVAALEDAVTKLVPRVVSANSDGRPGKVVINPNSAAQRVAIPITSKVGKPVYATHQCNGDDQSLIDVPAHGFAWVPAIERNGAGTTSKLDEIASQKTNDTQTQLILRNEFCEVRIDPQSGGIAGLYDFHTRGNRLSQRLSLRRVTDRDTVGQSWRPANQRARYSTMKADRCEITANSPLLGEVTASGMLCDEGDAAVADFQQTTRLQRGSRLVELQIQVTPRTELTDDPWNSYFASRFAWADESSLIYRDVNQSRQLTTAQRIESPLFVEIDAIHKRTAVLTGGLPYHRRVDRRQLDTILITKGESQTRFRLAIGVDCRSLVADAWSFVLPNLVVDHTVPPQAGSSWLFHINARHVVATHWSPRIEIIEVDGEPNSTCVGFTVRLLETLGRGGEIALQSFRPIKSAKRQNFVAEDKEDLQVIDGVARIKIRADEWTQIVVDW